MINLNACKYGLCSYYIVAKNEINSFENVALIYEYDEEMEKDYFVHCAILNDDGTFTDALGTYNSIEDMCDFVDVNINNLSYIIIKADDMKDFIISDTDYFDDDLYNSVLNVINN